MKVEGRFPRIDLRIPWLPCHNQVILEGGIHPFFLLCWQLADTWLSWLWTYSFVSLFTPVVPSLLATMLLDKSWTARQVVKTKLWGNLSAETKDTTKYGSVLFFFYVSAFPSFFFFFGALFKHAQALSSSVPEPKGQPSQQMLLIACPCSTHLLRLRAVIPLCYIVNMYIYFFHLFHWHYLTKSVQCIWSLRACSSSRDLNQKSHVGAA